MLVVEVIVLVLCHQVLQGSANIEKKKWDEWFIAYWIVSAHYKFKPKLATVPRIQPIFVSGYCAVLYGTLYGTGTVYKNYFLEIFLAGIFTKGPGFIDDKSSIILVR
jgi:hypothetical protein